MTSMKCKQRNGCLNSIILATIALLLPYPCHGESPLGSIRTRTNREINSGSLLLNERGGAVVATRKRNWKLSHPLNALPHSETAETAAEYWLEPVERYLRSFFVGEASQAPKAAVSTSSHRHKNTEERLTPAAITCKSSRFYSFQCKHYH